MPAGQSKKHFVMDERGLGGTHMIQQQFRNMFFKIRNARKHVDDDPPTTSMFHRPYFSQFGAYWDRIKAPALQCPAKVDSSPPRSFPLIANLYINKTTRQELNRNLKKNRPKRPQTAKDVKEAILPMRDYLVEQMERKKELQKDLEKIRRRRGLRSADAAFTMRDVAAAAALGVTGEADEFPTSNSEAQPRGSTPPLTAVLHVPAPPARSPAVSQLWIPESRRHNVVDHLPRRVCGQVSQYADGDDSDY